MLQRAPFLNQSKDDLETAETIFSNERYNQSLFMSSQGIEKIILLNEVLCLRDKLSLRQFGKINGTIERNNQETDVGC